MWRSRQSALGVNDLVVLDEAAQMIGGVAGLACRFCEGQRLGGEQLDRALKLGSCNVPEAS